MAPRLLAASLVLASPLPAPVPTADAAPARGPAGGGSALVQQRAEADQR